MINVEREMPTDPRLREEFLRLLRTVTSAMSFESVAQFIDVPKEVNGLTILDVGGGGSDFTATLIEKRADAYAVDHLYASRSDLKREVKKHVDSLKKQRMPYAATQERALERCIDSMKRNPDHYKAASATQLPFPDNYFDLVVSTSCIVPYLDLDREAFFTAVSECIRVTKPGGTIQIFPFQDEFPLFWDTRIRNQRALLLELHKNPNIDYNIQTTTDPTSGKLTLTKKF